MQLLSTWPPRNDFWVVPKLEMEVSQMGSSSTGNRMRKIGKRFDLGDACFRHRRFSVIWVSSSSRAIQRSACLVTAQSDIENRDFFYVWPNVLGYGCGLRGPCRPSVTYACTLEGQALASESVNQELDNGKMNELVIDERVKDGDFSKERDSGNVKFERNRSGRVDVKSLASSLRNARTAEDVEEVLKDKGELPLQVYSSMIKGFGKDKLLDSAMALVEWLKNKKKTTNGSVGPNLFIYNSLLGSVKESGRFGEAEKIMNGMVAEGVVPNVVTFNTLMGIYIEQGRELEALDLYKEIEKKGMSPSPASYSTVLLAYRRLEDGFGALQFYVDLKENYRKGIVGKEGSHDWDNEFSKLEDFTVRLCYQVMRRWLVKRENLSTNVLQLLTEMDRAALQNSTDEYGKLIWACTREEHYIVVKELYNRIRERDSDISLSVCNHAIWLMGKAKKWWAALEIYEDLLDKGPKPNTMSYELVVSHFNILLTAAKNRGIWRWGVRLLNKMEEKGLKPGSREWNAVLVACSKASETSAAVQIFKRMVERGEKPTIISYGALLSALEKGKLYDEALLVWDHMIKVGLEPNVYAYTIMASVYSAQGKFTVVDSIIRDMAASGITPTVVTFNAIISGCAQISMGNAAYEFFQKMKDWNISPNNVTYEKLIEALAKDGKPKLAYDMYLRALADGLDLSLKTYDAVVESSLACGATIDVSALGPKPVDKKKPVKIRKNMTEFYDLADVPRRSKPFDINELFPSRTEENLSRAGKWAGGQRDQDRGWC